MPAGFTTVYSTGNLIWKKVAGNFPYLARNVDKYLKRTVAFLPNPTEFKYANQTDGVGKVTVGAAVTTPTFTSTQTAFSGYDLLNTKINLFSTNAAYDPAKTILLIASDVTVPMGETAAKSIRSIETIANVTVGTGAAADRVGLTEFKIVKDTYVATGVEERMRKLDTITLYGNYYGAIIHTGTGTDASVSLPFGIDAKGLYAEYDLVNVDELEVIFGAGQTYTMGQDITMSDTVYKTVVGSNNTAVAGSQFAGTLDGDGKTIKKLRLIGEGGDRRMGIFARLGGGAGVKNLSVELGANITVSTQDFKGVGIIAGDTSTAGTMTIDNVHVDFKGFSVALTNSNFVGGLVGNTVGGSTVNISKSSVLDFENTTNNTNNKFVGGLVGYIQGTANISESFATGHVRGTLEQEGLLECQIIIVM